FTISPTERSAGARYSRITRRIGSPIALNASEVALALATTLRIFRYRNMSRQFEPRDRFRTALRLTVVICTDIHMCGNAHQHDSDARRSEALPDSRGAAGRRAACQRPGCKDGNPSVRGLAPFAHSRGGGVRPGAARRPAALVFVATRAVQ